MVSRLQHQKFEVEEVDNGERWKSARHNGQAECAADPESLWPLPLFR